MLRVVHINAKYGVGGVGGAAVAATRLHRDLLAAGIESHFFCTEQFEDGVNVHLMPARRFKRIWFFTVRKITRNIPRLFGSGSSLPMNIVPSGMARRINSLNPDTVIVHWISEDNISFQELSAIKAPMVAFLHDFWLLGGNEHHFPQGDVRYLEGYGKNNSSYWARRLFRKKQKLFKAKPNTIFVAPSRYAHSVVAHSLIGRRHRCAAIPSAIDSQTYRFQRELCPRHEEFVILFVAYHGRRNRYKGFEYLEEALRLIPQEIASSCRVKIMGETGLPYYINGVEISFSGVCTSEEMMLQAYHDADMLAFPSQAETQGLVKIEAMSCGLPVVAFDRTACAEGIIHQETGWIAPDGDIESFRDGILWWRERMEQPDWSSVRRNISSHAHGIYGATAVIEAWRELLRSSSREDLSQRAQRPQRAQVESF